MRERIISAILIICIMLSCGILEATVVHATESSLSVPANVYDLEKNSDYVIGEASPSASSAVGIFSIEGDVHTATEVNAFPAYEIRTGDATFSYEITSEVLNRTEDEWHIIDEKSKKVNGLTLDANIMSGALILQTSFDGITWTEDVLVTDIFAEEADTDGFYTTKDIQLQNGCYYRVIVAYKMERRVEDSKVLFVTTKNYEQKQVVEVYEFYAFCETDETKPDTTPMKKLEVKRINTGIDNGYSGNEPIDKDDPHFGWDIGYFFINGYTRETKMSDNTPVFLKNVGDKVTLWFHLSEDITKLHGNEHWTISEDTNGYDLSFELEPMNFERGIMIIQYTDSQGNVKVLPPYTDYLAANARTGANTKVQLFEEGDYVISLNYEIKSMGGPLNAFASYTNYKITFEFSIRNGNCMVYPFDEVTRSELADNAITENGFHLDMANSKYLTIDVQKSVLVVGTDGYLTEDVRFNRPAKDGEVYTSEGIYTFTVRNLYTNEETEKTIYVGSSSYLRALSATGMSIAELNAEIEKGSIIHEDGTIEAVVPVVTTPEETQEPTETETTPESNDPTTESTNTENSDTTEPVETVPFDDEKPAEINTAPFVIGAIAIVAVAMALIAAKRKKARVTKLAESVVVDEEEVDA